VARSHRISRPRHHLKRRRPSRARPVDTSGFATLLSFVDPSDPEAPTTVRGRSFPYQTLPAPGRATRATIALPDPGSTQLTNPVVAGAVPRGRAADRATPPGGGPAGASPAPGASAGAGLLNFPREMSNALLVSGRHSASGHPLAVMGPEVSYFTPQILMEEDIHGPGIDADGAAFPGVNLYVELGHGADYAWSATSSGQNIVDTFAAPLCNPTGPVSTQSSFYLLHGSCVPMETLTRIESWQPNLADSTPAGQVSLQTQRTAFGLVIARARIHGRPVAYTNLRSTYMHELDSGLGFERFNEPGLIHRPRDFFNAAYNVGYTFNWFYADDRHIGYFDSGHNPIRAPHTDPLFPSWSSAAWRGSTPAELSSPVWTQSAQTPPSAHPQAIDQDFLTSWNNKQAPGYSDPATAQEFSSIYRSKLLDTQIQDRLGAGGGKMSLTDLVNAMGDAGTQDLRRTTVLPYLLAVVGHPRDPALAQAVAELRTWQAGGSHRIKRASPRCLGHLPAGRRHPDHGRLAAAAGPRRVRTGARNRAARSGAGRVPDQRPARAWHQRSPPGPGLRRRLLRDRAEGPAQGSAPAGGRSSTAPSARSSSR